MNRLAQTICILGVAAAGFTPVLLYAKQDGRSASVESGASVVSNPEAVTVAVWTPPAEMGCCATGGGSAAHTGTPQFVHTRTPARNG